jgi:hypothetical protein
VDATEGRAGAPIGPRTRGLQARESFAFGRTPS